MYRAPKSQSGFSLMEALFVVAVVGVVAAMAMVGVTHTNEAARVTKLESDVAAINQAVKVYITSGGSVAGITEPQAVLDKMKTVRAADQAENYAGLRESMLDKRLAVELQSAAEAATADPRAVWVSAKEQFEIVKNGVGVKRFYVNSALGTVDYGEETRDGSFVDFETEVRGWIWAYQDSQSEPIPTPTDIPDGGTTGGSDGADAGDDDGGTSTAGDDADGGDDGGDTADGGDDGGDDSGDPAQQLVEPSFNPANGEFHYSEFPLTVEVTNPNPGGWIMVSVNGAPFTPYSSAVSVESSVVVSAYVDGDPADWITSSTAATSFTVESYQLVAPTITTSDPQFQAGIEAITVTLSNPNPTDISSLVYQLDNGTQIAYDGPFSLERENHPDGVSIHAKAIGNDSFAIESPITTAFIANEPDPLEKPLIGLSSNEFNADTPTIVATISNPNPVGSSQLMYAVIDPSGTFPAVAGWTAYSGPVALQATDYPDGFTIRAFADSLSDSLYIDSDFAEATTTAFFDVPINDDVLFVIDASGSMDSGFNDMTRFEAVIEELVRTIPTLPDSIKFGVAMFDSGIEWVSTSDNLFTMVEPDPDTLYAMGVDPCQFECDAVEGYVLIDATEENKLAMISAIQQVSNGGGTNYEVGLRFPVQFDPMPAQVIFLSDGRPNSGDYPGGSWSDEVEDLAELGIRVDTIGMQLGDDELGNLEWIAGTTGGSLTILQEGADDDLNDNNGLLDEPVLVPDGAAFGAESYPLTVTLTNPNVFDLSSYIMYRIDGGPYQLYTSPITLSGPALLETYVDSNTQGMTTSDVGYDNYTLAP